MKYDVKGTGLVVVTVDADSDEEAVRLVKEKFEGLQSYKLNDKNCVSISSEIKVENKVEHKK